MVSKLALFKVCSTFLQLYIPTNINIQLNISQKNRNRVSIVIDPFPFLVVCSNKSSSWIPVANIKHMYKIRKKRHKIRFTAKKIAKTSLSPHFVQKSSHEISFSSSLVPIYEHKHCSPIERSKWLLHEMTFCTLLYFPCKIRYLEWDSHVPTCHK